MKKLNTLLLAGLATLPLAAMADIRFYGGFGAGGARLEQDLNITYAAFESDGTTFVPVVDRSGTPITNPNYGRTASSTLDKFNGTDIGYRVFAGMLVGRYLGFEAGYVSLGEAEDEVPLTIPGTSGPTPSTILCNGCRPQTDVLLVMEDEVDGWEAFVLGMLPVAERWDVFAKVGVINWDSNFSAKNGFREVFTPTPVNVTPSTVPTTEPETFGVDDDGTDLAGGIGFNYKAGEHLLIRGEGTWYDIENVEQAWLLGFNLIYLY